MPEYERDLDAIKEDIRSRSDIVEIIGQYTRLQKKGKNWKGLCPFHSDKNPSFDVSPILQIYKCWSCGEAGDVFKFVQKKENLDFIEAMEWLAKRAGIPFQRHAANPERASEREQMFELNLLATRYFQARLGSSQEAQEYLAGRGILKSTQDQFEIGFAPDQWDGLMSHLEQKRADLELAARIGLIKSREEADGYYDAFRNRLMFPIHDVSGRVIAFGGRALGDHPAKYLNSEQSDLFDKSKTLYGLNFARKKLSGDVPAVFVEGYVDVVTTHQAGFAQCVATLGTSMTEEHARLLVRYNPRVIICYDGDSAGIKATLRGTGVWESIGVEGAEVRVARLPPGEDPDSLLRKGDTAAFQAALDKAIPRVDFQLELALRHHDLSTAPGRDAALAEAIPILASIHSRSQKERQALELARLHPASAYNLGRAVEQIVAEAEEYARNSRAPVGRDAGYPQTQAMNQAQLARQPGAPVYQRGNKESWGKQWPGTREVIRKDENGAAGSGQGGGYRSKREVRKGPASDPTPPSIAPPLFTGVEKAEMQLLRAVFAPEWRTLILGRLQPDSLVTAHGKALFERVARTPASDTGGIDPLALMRALENEEAAQDGLEGNAETDGELASAGEYGNTQSRQSFSKLSSFIRELWEDSASLLSNEPLNDAVISDCIRRLQKHRDEKANRELVEFLKTLPPNEHRAYFDQYHKRMRDMRGSPPDVADG